MRSIARHIFFAGVCLVLCLRGEAVGVPACGIEVFLRTLPQARCDCMMALSNHAATPDGTATFGFKTGIPISTLRNKIKEIKESGIYPNLLIGVRQFVVDLPDSEFGPEDTATVRIGLLYDMLTILRDENGLRFGVIVLPRGARLFFGPDRRIGIVVREDGIMFQGVIAHRHLDEHNRVPQRSWRPTYATDEDEALPRVEDIFYRLHRGWRPQ